MVPTVNEPTFSIEVLQSRQPVLVNFWAPWCGLCRLITPTLLQLQQQHQGYLKIVSINADENFKLANTYRLRNLPTLMLFQQGKITYRIEEFNGREELQRSLEGCLDSLLARR